MPESVVDVKNMVNHYKDLILKKEELTKEYNNYLEMYKDVSKLLGQLRTVYEMERTEEAKAELDSWLKQEKDYLEEINSYYEKFQEIDQELGEIDVQMFNEYVANSTRFQEISSKMKEIEMATKKISATVNNGIKIVKIPNGEGRNKKVAETFAIEYQKLAEEKRRLAKLKQKQYNSLFNQVPGNNNTQDITILPPEKPEVSYDEGYFDKLSNEEKLKELEVRMERMRNGHGKKMTIKYKGESIRIPSQYNGYYQVCRTQAEKLRELIKKENSAIDDALNNINRIEAEENQKIDDWINLIKTTGRSMTPEEAEFRLKQQIAKAEVEQREFEAQINLIPKVDPVDTSYSSDDPLFDQQNDELSAMLKKNADNNTNGDNKKQTPNTLPDNNKKDENKGKDNLKKPLGFLKIKSIKKPKNPEKLKKVIIACAAVIASAAVWITAATAIYKNYSKGNLSSQTSTVATVDKPESDVTLEVTPTDQVEVQDEVVDSNSVTEASPIRLGEQYTLSNNTDVYVDMYDATLSRDGLMPLYDTNINRTVDGLAIRLDGEMKMVYSYEDNAQAKVDELVAMGGEITAVYSNLGGKEGYFNINDVVFTQQNTLYGGISR